MLSFNLPLEDFKVKRKPLTKLQVVTNYLIVLVALFAVNPFFGMVQNYYLMFFMFFLLVITVKRNGKFMDHNMLRVLLFAYSLVIIQNLLYGGISLATLYIPLIIFYVPFLIFQLLGFIFYCHLYFFFMAVAKFCTSF